jgi:hypothetical protein
MAALGWIIGPIVGYYLGLRSQRIQRETIAKEEAKGVVDKEKAEFGVIIQQHIVTLPERGVMEFYSRTKTAIRDAVFRVRRFITDEQRAGLDRLWREYDQIPARELDPKHEGAKGEMVRALCKIAKPPSEFKTPCEIVRYYLDEFYKCAA